MPPEHVRKRKKIHLTGSKTILAVGVTLMFLMLISAVVLGSVNISPLMIGRIVGTVFGLSDEGVDPAERVVILLIRLPRVVTALLAGSGLAVSGTIMQGIFRNPLAEPGSSVFLPVPA